jgi:hypothetical protein
MTALLSTEATAPNALLTMNSHWATARKRHHQQSKKCSSTVTADCFRFTIATLPLLVVTTINGLPPQQRLQFSSPQHQQKIPFLAVPLYGTTRAAQLLKPARRLHEKFNE